MIGIGVERVFHAFVDAARAVVVHEITDLRRRGADRQHTVVAVRREQAVARARRRAEGVRRPGTVPVAVHVHVVVRVGRVFVGHVVAVVVDAVARVVHRTGVGGGDRIAAVRAGGHGAGDAVVAVPVGVGVGHARARRVELGGAREGEHVAVVAVGRVHHEVHGHAAGRGGDGGIAVPVVVRIRVVGGGAARLVHRAVAVVVRAVAGLDRAGVDRGARVVAVGADVRRRGDGDVHVRHGIERADVLPIREDVGPAAGDGRLGVEVAVEADHLGGVEAGGVRVGDGGAGRETGRRVAGHARGGRDRVVAIVEVLLKNAVLLLAAGGEGEEDEDGESGTEHANLERTFRIASRRRATRLSKKEHPSRAERGVYVFFKQKSIKSQKKRSGPRQAFAYRGPVGRWPYCVSTVQWQSEPVP